MRKSRGVPAADLARHVHVTRQTIYAIEAGTYVPQHRSCSVSGAGTGGPRRRVVRDSARAGILARIDEGGCSERGDACRGQPVRICQVGNRWVGIPVSASPYLIPEADGIVKRTRRTSDVAELDVFSKGDATQKRLVLAGCDPAAGLLSRMVADISGVEIVPVSASSKLALAWLKEGKVHIAGSHLEDPKTGEFNLPFIRRAFPDEDFTVVTFARWEEGLVLAPGNPNSIRKIEDLARKHIRFVNREPGSGSRALLDGLLQKSGIDCHRIRGYDRVAYGHLAAAHCVTAGEADVCLATRSAARTFGLDFVPLHSERYDFVMRKRTADLHAVKAFMDVLQRATLRRKLEVLAGYDTSQTGTVLCSW